VLAGDAIISGKTLESPQVRLRPAPDRARAAGNTHQALTPATLAATAADGADFAAWCGARGVAALPAAPVTVAATLATLATRWRRLYRGQRR